jgi:heat-inducible transcriptional repressor
MDLSRRELILKYIVEFFIKHAEPVGSKTLIEAYNLNYSSATIRNEMLELENLGYLEKTHTSSGRVPSNKGYKYYIEHLRERSVDEEVKNELAILFTQRSKSIEDVIKESCMILSHMTNLASVVLGPNAEQENLLSIKFLPLSETTGMVIYATDKGYCEHKSFVLPKETNMKDVQDCVKLLNDRLVGTPVSQLLEKTELLRPMISDLVKNNDAIYQAIAQAMLQFSAQRVSMFGSDNLSQQPEFSDDADKLKKLIKLIQSPEMLKDIVNDDNGLEVHIGENDNLEDVSVISSDIEVNGEKKGTIALVGPKRMDYDKIISAFEYLIDQLDKYGSDDVNDKEDGNGRRN